MGFIYKLRRNGIFGKIFQLLISFLDSRKQRVLLNGQCSSWGFINARVAQRSILGPLLFSIYVNDLTENLQSNPKLFADNTSLFTLINDPNAIVKQLCENWDKRNGLSNGKSVLILIHPNKPKKLFSLVRSKMLYIHKFSLMINQFNKSHHKNT